MIPIEKKLNPTTEQIQRFADRIIQDCVRAVIQDIEAAHNLLEFSQEKREFSQIHNVGK